MPFQNIDILSPLEFPEMSLGLNKGLRDVIKDDSVEDNETQDIAISYLNDMASYSLLGHTEEQRLARRIKKGYLTIINLCISHTCGDKGFCNLQEAITQLLGRTAKYPGLWEKMVNKILGELPVIINVAPDLEYLQKKIKKIADKIQESQSIMVKGNLRLVLSVAKKYLTRGIPFLDLVQEGNVGLIKATSRYDYTTGNKFSTYAIWWIKQSIIRAIYEKTRTVRLPVHFIEIRSKYYSAYYNLLKKNGHEPSAHEISVETGLSIDKINAVIMLPKDMVYLDTKMGEDDISYAEQFIYEDKESPFDRLSNHNLKCAMNELLETLTEREKNIIKSRFGLNGETPKTLEKIGKRLNISKERIRQIEKRAIKKLQYRSNKELKMFLSC